jgi:rare lipoprotein A (peptidoglycan hydrolase)
MTALAGILLGLVVAAGLTMLPAARYAGTATWYCSDGRDGSPRSACTVGYGPSDLVAAIDTDLGIGKGERIRIRFGAKSVDVLVVDVCACAGERAVDLTIGAFQKLAPWGYGVLPVTVEVVGDPQPRITLPPTDTEVNP